ncbi:hypothetical protein [Polluticaenibacter yanchengensis]|uniref:Uncharacterized protein n=1 Tax=Polluticaenibacter yanchengensis TaxID=3014562 RepID=A0ABT4UI58_9BACT|nr:hypothetical protein [Chitinophagaceae bacterium LY-5]
MTNTRATLTMQGSDYSRLEFFLQESCILNLDDYIKLWIYFDGKESAR